MVRFWRVYAAVVLAACGGSGSQAGGSSQTLDAGADAVDGGSQQGGTVVQAASLHAARGRCVAVTLRDGRTLFAGGNASAGAELYDPVSNTFTPTRSMSIDRDGAAAALLPDGKVLVVGGLTWLQGEQYLSSAEIYDPATGTFARSGAFPEVVDAPSVVALPDGRILFAGGFAAGGPGRATASAWLYDEASGTFAPTGGMSVPRYGHTTTLLPNGKVLVAGGTTTAAGGTTAELYDPATGTFTSTGALLGRRSFHTATLLANGNVLFAGGTDGNDGGLTTAEIYDTASGTFAPAGTMHGAQAFHSAARLSDGRVLLSGGLIIEMTILSRMQIFDPASGSFSAAANLLTPRVAPAALVLPNGKVLLATGTGYQGALSTAELFAPPPKAP